MTTFVLVPGAWLGSWAWSRVTHLLEEKGHEARPLTLTGMGDKVHLASKDVGVETAVEDVYNYMEYEDLRDVVLVGHSFAGKVVARVGDRALERVKMILYLDAFRPSKVRTPQGVFDPAEFTTVPAGSWSIPFKEAFINNIGKDLTVPDRKWLLEKATPWPLKHVTDPITLTSRFDSIPSAYIFCTGGGDPVEEVIQGKWGALEGPYRVIDSGHWPMISKPEELAADMMSLAGSN